MKKAMLGALLAMAVMTAQAATRQDVESSAVVNGTIVLTQDGTVQSAVIDDPAKYGQPIADMVRNAALQWHFQPLLQDGQPVVAKASMHARVVLKQKPDGNYTARIKGVTFGDYNSTDTDTLHITEDDKKIFPHYPEMALRAHVQGEVYLALHIDHGGHVTDAVVEQVNLDNIGPDTLLNECRKMLADAALQAARRWTYTIPTTGRLAKQDSWTARVPVIFNLAPPGQTTAPEVVWRTYVPGPYTPAPWVDKPNMGAADALAGSGVQTDGAGPTLLSAPNHG
ncbi:energy transducer TonB [Rhodanobacter sp. 7MK24]|uniref:energy transducer TonB n=1 Tax=Rhodanobacter sp. 7MK24 TaxID=2775922 RepID=UPI00177CC0AE|nr:energy transducer TonB [Rhodanobacter sp. 7MK24]MBD8880271.1 energy transducer TonB [Rhodanobacter sp. 7MK24]